MRQDDGRITSFVERLEALGPGERARLKRNAGKHMEESRGVMGLFFHLLPPAIGKWDEPAFFLVATFFPLAGSAAEGNLGSALRRIRTEENQEGLDRRFEVLLDASSEQLPYYLRQAVRMLGAKDVPVCWTRLLADLTNWSHTARFVQEQWARSYFQSPIPTKES